jgi:hypothetical protein
VTPTVPVTAPPIDACDDWRALLHGTLAFSSVGTPALSVPCGFTKAGLPVGLQLVGKWWEEETLFRIGAIYEAATDWHVRRPAFESAPVPNHAPPPQETQVSEETEEATVGRKTVGELAKVFGLPVAEDALDALTMRVDQMFRSLRRLDDLPLDDIEPGAYFVVPGPGEDPA